MFCTDWTPLTLAVAGGHQAAVEAAELNWANWQRPIRGPGFTGVLLVGLGWLV